MIIKKLTGEILSSMGIISDAQLQAALAKQKKLIIEEAVPYRVKRADLVANARNASDSDKTAMLGRILLEMGAVTLA